jgi:hypothetical protein
MTRRKDAPKFIWAVTKEAHRALLVHSTNTQRRSRDIGYMITLTHPGTCSYCHRVINAGEQAAHDIGANIIYCTNCITVEGEDFGPAFDKARSA